MNFLARVGYFFTHLLTFRGTYVVCSLCAVRYSRPWALQNSWTDRHAVWQQIRVSQIESHIRWGSKFRNGKGKFTRIMYPAALGQYSRPVFVPVGCHPVKASRLGDAGRRYNYCSNLLAMCQIPLHGPDRTQPSRTRPHKVRGLSETRVSWSGPSSGIWLYSCKCAAALQSYLQYFTTTDL